jgi:glutathione S-transferase
MMKLYSFSPTPNNRKVEAFIKHFDLPVEIHSMGFKEKENKTEAYLKMNPLGKAPVLEDGDFTLWESNAILCYLATLFPETNCLPSDPQGRAEVDRWLYWQAFHLLNMVVAQRDKSAGVDKDTTMHLGLLNNQLEGRDYVLGELSLVDFAIAPYLLGRHGQAIDYTDFPNVRAWLDRCNELKGMVASVFKPPGAPSQRSA